MTRPTGRDPPDQWDAHAGILARLGPTPGHAHERLEARGEVGLLSLGQVLDK